MRTMCTDAPLEKCVRVWNLPRTWIGHVSAVSHMHIHMHYSHTCLDMHSYRKVPAMMQVRIFRVHVCVTNTRMYVVSRFCDTLHACNTCAVRAQTVAIGSCVCMCTCWVWAVQSTSIYVCMYACMYVCMYHTHVCLYVLGCTTWPKFICLCVQILSVSISICNERETTKSIRSTTRARP